MISVYFRQSPCEPSTSVGSNAIIAIFIALFLCLLHGSAIAIDDSYANNAIEFKQSIQEALEQLRGKVSDLGLRSYDDFAHLINGALVSILQIFDSGPDLKPFGLLAVPAFAVIQFALLGARFAGGFIDISGAIVEGVKVFLCGLIALSTFIDVPIISNVIGGGTLSSFIEEGAYQLAGMAPGSNPFAQFFSPWVEAAYKLYDLPVIDDQLTGYRALFFIIENLPFIIIILLLQFGCIILLALAALATVGHMVLAMLHIKLLIYTAPLLAPFLLFPPLSFLWKAWISAFIAGSISLFLASLYAKGGVVFLGHLSSTLPVKDMYSSISLIMLYLSVMIALAVYKMVASKVDNMAKSLVTGQSVGGFSIRDLMSGIASLGTATLPMAMAAGAAVGAASHAIGSRMAQNSSVKAAEKMKGGSLSSEESKAARESGAAKFKESMGGGVDKSMMAGAKKAANAIRKNTFKMDKNDKETSANN